MFPVTPKSSLQITPSGNSKFSKSDRSLPRCWPQDGTTATTTSKSPAVPKAVETMNVALENLSCSNVRAASPLSSTEENSR